MRALFLLPLLIIISMHAQADRWIALNPKTDVRQFAHLRVLQEVTFAKDHFVVFETDIPSASDKAPLQRLLNAEDVQPDFPIGLVSPVTGTQPQEDSGWHINKLGYKDLPEEFDGRGIIVADLDTGFDIAHPALTSHIWNNPHVGEGGFENDVHGYNFVDGNADITGTPHHGTHTAGLIVASKQNNGEGQGVAPGATLMPLKILGSGNAQFLSHAAIGIKYAVDRGAKILSNSWRIYKSWNAFYPTNENTKLLRDAIEYAGSKGVLFVAAAGNESQNLDTHNDPIYPAGYEGLDNLVVVAATNSADELPRFSNFGSSHVHVAAPGAGILSTLPGGIWGLESGTSMATPIVAGALARALSAGQEPLEAFKKLISSSDATDALSEHVAAKGRINIKDLLQKDEDLNQKRK